LDGAAQLTARQRFNTPPIEVVVFDVLFPLFLRDQAGLLMGALV
jgi:hypothetical protein